MPRSDYHRYRKPTATTAATVAADDTDAELTASALNFGTHRARSLDALSDMVGDARCFRVSWRDPREAAALLLSAISRSVSGASTSCTN